MNEIFGAISTMFMWERGPYTSLPKVDTSLVAFEKTSKQFENAFIQVTGHGQKQVAKLSAPT